MSHSKSLQTPPTSTYLPEAANPSIGTVTSSFFVCMEGVFQKANVTTAKTSEGALENSVQLLWYTCIEERISIGTMTSDFQASATLVHSLVEMHVMTDSAMPTLRQYLRSNVCIDNIWIIRVGHLGQGGENTELYSSKFSNCFLESIEEFPDKLILKARITQRSDTAAETDFDGTQSGNDASSWDYKTNSPAVDESGGGAG